MDDDADTAHCPPADAWELPRRPRSRIDDALLLGAIMLALGILWGADMADRLTARLRWHLGLALVRVAEQLDRVGGRLLPDEPPPGTEDARTVAILQAIAAAEDPRPSRPLRSRGVHRSARAQGNGHASAPREKGDH